MKLAAVPSAIATVLAALLIVAPVLVGCSSTSQGTITGSDGATYTGEVKAGIANSQGTAKYADGGTYIGEWDGDLPNGQGTKTAVDGTTYTGEWKDGEPVP